MVGKLGISRKKESMKQSSNHVMRSSHMQLFIVLIMVALGTVALPFLLYKNVTLPLFVYSLVAITVLFLLADYVLKNPLFKVALVICALINFFTLEYSALQAEMYGLFLISIPVLLIFSFWYFQRKSNVIIDNKFLYIGREIIINISFTGQLLLGTTIFYLVADMIFPVLLKGLTPFFYDPFFTYVSLALIVITCYYIGWRLSNKTLSLAFINAGSIVCATTMYMALIGWRGYESDKLSATPIEYSHAYDFLLWPLELTVLALGIIFFWYTKIYKSKRK